MLHPGTKITLQQRERLRVIGIESSCDETGVAVYDSEKGLMADLLYSQIDLHKEYGGVVPELASRDHIRKTLPMIDQALSESGSTKHEIDGVAYTDAEYEAKVRTAAKGLRVDGSQWQKIWRPWDSRQTD